MKKMRIFLVLAVVACAAMAFTATSWINVSGYVESSDGDALSNVEVRCIQNSNNTLQSTTFTDAFGHYTISVPTSTSCRLEFSLNGFVPVDKNVKSDVDLDGETGINVIMDSQQTE